MGAVFTIQTLLQKKVFGNHLAGTKPLEYRRNEWQELNKGRERSVRLIVRAMLGVPSAHQSEQEHALWCFQFQTGSLLVVYLQRGTVIELAAKQEAEAEEDKDKEIEEAVDFLIEEVTTRLRQL